MAYGCNKISSLSVSLMLIGTFLLSACDSNSSGDVIATGENSVGEGAIGESDNLGSTATDTVAGSAGEGDAAGLVDNVNAAFVQPFRFGDRYWAELAQDFPPFIPEPDVGAANGDEDRDILGEWAAVVDWPLIAAGAANLPDGRILGWSSSSVDNFGGGPFTHATIYNPTDQSFVDVPHETHNMFCAGVSMLEDGRVFAAGGGSTVQSVSSFFGNDWSAEQDMTTARWYPTSTTLPSGQVVTSLGTNNTGLSELWTEDSGWRLMSHVDLSSVLADPTTNSGPANWYPALNVAPDGKLFHPGPTSEMLSIDLDSLAGTINHGLREADNTHRLYGATVMYDVGKMLMAGGGTPAIDSAITIDINGSAPVVAETNTPTFARTFQNTIVLPNGHVLMIGGNQNGVQFNDDTTVLTPEIWDPATGVWSQLAAHERPRNYHSTALLMKDGRVASMGGGICGGCATNHQNSEIFSPPYLFDVNGDVAARPVINSGTATAVTGDSLTLNGSNNIAAFNMLRLAALTHHHTTDQRFIPLNFQASGGDYALELPSNPNVLIPGFYWVFALDANGVPSQGHTVQILATAGEVSAIAALDPNQSSFDFEYYEGSWDVLPDFDALSPVESGQFASISLAPRQAADNYGFRFTGIISLPTAGDYTFYLTSDDGSRLTINDIEVVDNDGLHGARQESSNISLAAGTHAVVVEYFEKTGGELLVAEVEGPGLPRQSLSALLAPVDTVLDNSPVAYEYFEGRYTALPEFDLLTPAATGRQSNLTLDNRLRNNNFAFRFSTGLQILEPGAYTFYLTSDDGSSLRIDDNLLISNDGVHGAKELLNTSTLDAGLHKLELQFFDETRGEVLTLEISGPGLPRQVIDSLLTPYVDTGAPVPNETVAHNPGFLRNGGFESDQANWTVCGGGSGIRSSIDARTGGSALAISGAGCLYQEIPIDTGDEVALECFAKADNSGFASLSLTNSDENYTALNTDSLQIVGNNNFNRYATSLVAPNGASNAVVVLYSDAVSTVDDCQLSINGSVDNGDQATTVAQTPLVSPIPASSGDNLLINGGFESQLQDWSACTAINGAAITASAASGSSALSLSTPTCLFQVVSLNDTGTVHAACEAANDSNDHTSISLSFSDGNFASLGSTSVAVTGSGYNLATTSGAIPSEAAYAAITLYSEGDARMDDCQIVIDPL